MQVRNPCSVLKSVVSLAVLIACVVPSSGAQQTNAIVPTLVRFSSTLTDASDKPLPGTVSSDGLPTDVFVSGEARWLGVQPQGQAEQTRVLLLSVPYALKAGDAQTVGGLPASAFVLAAPAGGNTAVAASGANPTSAGIAPPPAIQM